MSNDLKILFDEIERRGLKVAEFAKEAGVEPMRVYGWKAGRGHPKGPDYVKVQQWLANEKGAEMPPNDHFVLSVILHRVAFLLSKQSGNSEVVELKQIEKDAELLMAMSKS